MAAAGLWYSHNCWLKLMLYCESAERRVSVCESARTSKKLINEAKIWCFSIRSLFISAIVCRFLVRSCIRFSDLKMADWRTARRTATICQFSCCDLMMIVFASAKKKSKNKTGNTKRSRVELHRRWTTHIRRINERSQRLITNCIKKKRWLSRAIIHIF